MHEQMSRTNRLPPLELGGSNSQKHIGQGIAHNRSQSEVPVMERPVAASEQPNKSPTRPKLEHKKADNQGS